MPDQSRIKVLIDKADLLFFMGELDEALKCYNQYLDKCPLDIYAWSYKAALLKRMGNYTDALICYNEINKIDASFLETYYVDAKDSSFGGIDELGSALCAGLDINYVEQRPERIMKVTVEQVNAAIKLIFNTNEKLTGVLLPVDKRQG